MTVKLFEQDAYLCIAEGVVQAVQDDGAILLDQTNFTPNTNQRVGDTGFFEREDGTIIDITSAHYAQNRQDIYHIKSKGAPQPKLAERLTLHINWENRYKMMRMYTACHLLTDIIPQQCINIDLAPDSSTVDFNNLDHINLTDTMSELTASVALNNALPSTHIKGNMQQIIDATMPEIYVSEAQEIGQVCITQDRARLTLNFGD